jgi:hypothetical protein
MNSKGPQLITSTGAAHIISVIKTNITLLGLLGNAASISSTLVPRVWPAWQRAGHRCGYMYLQGHQTRQMLSARTLPSCSDNNLA